MAPSPQSSIVRNRLLAGLPQDVLAQILPRMNRIPLGVRDTLAVSMKTIPAVYFMESGWVSMVAHMDEGSQAEVGLIGREGMVGAPIAMDVETAYAEAYVQAAGEALSMETRAFQRELAAHPPLLRRVLRYAEAMNAQVMQTAACNGRHNLEQRLSRWILMARDRAEDDDLPLTQEFLALMLCVQRPSITVVARTLQQAGLIRYSQGRITVLDRTALEAASCTCYRAVRQRFDQLLD